MVSQPYVILDPRQWLLTESVHKLLLYMVVTASGDLKTYRNVVSLWIIFKYTLFLVLDMRYNCVMRFLDGYRG